MLCPVWWPVTGNLHDPRHKRRMFGEENWGFLELPGWRKNETSQRTGNNQGLDNHCPHLSSLYRSLTAGLPPTGAYTLTTLLYLQARTKYNLAGGLWPQRLHQDSVCVLQMAFHLGADLLPSSIGLLVDQAHSVVVSRVHVLPGCWGQRQFLASGFYLRLLTSW